MVSTQTQVESTQQTAPSAAQEVVDLGARKAGLATARQAAAERADGPALAALRRQEGDLDALLAAARIRAARDEEHQAAADLEATEASLAGLELATRLADTGMAVAAATYEAAQLAVMGARTDYANADVLVTALRSRHRQAQAQVDALVAAARAL